jgi:hypothetical protein
MMQLLLSLEISLHHRYEGVLALAEALYQRLLGVLGEVFTLNNKVMQVVSKVLCANMTTMAVKDTKEAHLRPIALPMLILGLQDIQDNTDSVLIVLSDNALIGIGSIGLDYAALLVRSLGNLMVLQLKCLRIKWDWVFTKQKGLHIYKCYIGRTLVISGSITRCRFVRRRG